MNGSWTDFPQDYRNREIQVILRWICSGECGAILGVSGSGKSNLLGFLANRVPSPAGCPQVHLADCNRLNGFSRAEIFRFLANLIEGYSQPASGSAEQEMTNLESILASRLGSGVGLCLLLDRFDSLFASEKFPLLENNLRSLRDAHKYQLTYIIAARRPGSEESELSELFYGHTLWLRPLAKSDAIWSAKRDLKRMLGTKRIYFDEEIVEKIVEFSSGYPSLLRAGCEAFADGCKLELEALLGHPAVDRRCREFWADNPAPVAIAASGLGGQPLLEAFKPGVQEPQELDTRQLTAKENLLLGYLRSHTDQVCEKDDLIRAVWPEDVIFARGIRDDSLAQLVRRAVPFPQQDFGFPDLLRGKSA